MKSSLGIAALVVLVAGLAVVFWPRGAEQGRAGFASGNGRIEATEVDVAARFAARLEAVLVREGDFVAAGQVLARMDTRNLQAQREEAIARAGQAEHALAGARAEIALRAAEAAAARAGVAERAASLEAARRRLSRSERLVREGFFSPQALEDDAARVDTQRAALEAARAQVAAIEAAGVAARAATEAAQSGVRAAQASIERIDADIADSTLKAPRAARVQYLVAQPGEVLAVGAKVLNLADLSDVFMTFYLPETVAGKVAIGAEARIVLDAAPQSPIPAKISFVASEAQFTPKTVETALEREKLMFRVKAQIDPARLERYRAQVKTGVPGVAWVRVDPRASWPPELEVRAGR